MGEGEKRSSQNKEGAMGDDKKLRYISVADSNFSAINITSPDDCSTQKINCIMEKKKKPPLSLTEIIQHHHTLFRDSHLNISPINSYQKVEFSLRLKENIKKEVANSHFPS